MKLRSKLIISLLFLAVAVAVSIRYVWLPSYLNYEAKEITELTQQELTVLADSLSSDLIANNLTSLHHTLDSIKQVNTSWRRLTLTDPEGRVLYPFSLLTLPPPEAPGITTVHSSVSHNGIELGRLTLSVDLGPTMHEHTQRIIELQWLLTLLIITMAAAAYATLEHWVISPLAKLREYAQAIAAGEYSKQPDYHSKDEIGELAKAFAFMGREVEHREHRLEQGRDLGDLILTIQNEYISNEDKQHIFSDLQARIVQLTGTELCYISEVLYDSHDTPSLKIFSEVGQPAPANLTPLLTEVVTSGQPVVKTGPNGEQKTAPDGEHEINTFFGMPIHSGTQLVGVLALANWQGDYRDLLSVEEGLSLLSTLGSLIVAYRARDAVKESEARFRSVIDGTLEGIISTNASGAIKIFNHAAEEIFGYSAQEVMGQRINMLMPDSVAAEHDSYMSQYGKTQFSHILGVKRELRGKRKNGELFPVELAISKVEIADGFEFIGVIRDISERKRHQQQMQVAHERLAMANVELEKLARKDSLTALYNRRHFDEMLQTELRRAARKHQNLSLLIADVDYFKRYNDHYGHQAGDHCLQAVANVMRNTFNRAGEISARYGGEEFVVIMPDLSHTQAYTMADKMRQAMEDLSIPHTDSLVAGVVTLSIGIVTLEPDQYTSPEVIIELADQALYRAKSQGRNNVQHNVIGKNIGNKHQHT